MRRYRLDGSKTNNVGGPDGQGQKISWPIAQPKSDLGPEDHTKVNWEDDQDVFLLDETMLTDWTEVCSNRITCIGLVDRCIYEAIKKCIEIEND